MRGNKKKEFDLIFSLGGSCATSKQLRLRDLQILSLPFDWLFHVNDEQFRALEKGFLEDFSNWMLKRNMSELEGEERSLSDKMQYKDNYTSFRFIHDYKHPVNSKKCEHEKIRQKYQRRINRLYEIIAKSKKVLLIVDVDYDINIQTIESLLNALSSKFSGTKFHAVVQRFKSAEGDTDLLQISDGISIYNRRRNRDNVDYAVKHADWNWLRKIKLSFIGRNILQQQLLSNILLFKVIKKTLCLYILKGFLPNVLRLKLRLIGIKLDISIGELRE